MSIRPMINSCFSVSENIYNSRIQFVNNTYGTITRILHCSSYRIQKFPMYLPGRDALYTYAYTQVLYIDNY